MTTEKPTLVLIDGHALAYRAYFGMPANFNTSRGEPTHAVYGFINMILAVWHEHQPDYFIVTFDLGDTFRHEMYSEYKATREKMPDDLPGQIARIDQVMRVLNMPIFTKEGYEADDLLGTLANQAAAQGIEALIVTGDRDAFQLVAPNIKVIISGKKFADREVYDEAKVIERYGVPPAQLIDLKGLIGDTSDNIPGVKGIGEKGGAKLIQDYGTLENIYANLDKLTPSLRAKLEADHDNAFLSRDLGRIITNVPGVQFDKEAAKTRNFDIVAVAKVMVELEFNTIFNRIPGAPRDKSPQEVVRESERSEDEETRNNAEEGTRMGEEANEQVEESLASYFGESATRNLADSQPPHSQPHYYTVDSSAKLAELVAKLRAQPHLAVDVETDSVDETQTNLVGIAITPTIGEGYYIPLRHGMAKTPPQQASMFELATAVEELPSIPQLPLAEVQAALAPILADSQKTKYLHNAKFDLTVLERHGLPVLPPIFDTMIASWLTNNATEARHGLKDLAWHELNVRMTPIKELIGAGKKQVTMMEVSVEQATPYAAADVDMTLRLAEIMQPRLQANEGISWQLFQALELPLIYVLKDMELAGIRLDVPILQQMSIDMGRQLDTLTTQIYHVSGRSFNINSPQQVATILFRELGLSVPGMKTTSSGHYSTGIEVLQELRGQHEIIELMMQYRQLAKLKSTYVDALPALINPMTQRLHTNYNQIGIATGRLSSNNPNLQNIPIRTEQGREIRRAFISAEGCKLISADYSQVELRILAHIAQDPGLLQAFANDEDIHAATAATVLGVPITEIDKYQRRVAKAVNFGLVYGQTAFGLAQGTGMSQSEARQFIERYFEKYPGVKRYIEQTKRVAAQQGYITTLLGRRREFAGLANLRGAQRGRVEREAINSPIQGTAADIIKQAMIDLHAALKQRGWQTRMLLQVHDELVLEAPEAEVAAAVALTREVMSQAFALQVPLKVEVEVGDNWLDMGS